MWPEALQAWMVSNGYGRQPRRQALSGGSISQAWQVSAPGKDALFVKVNEQAPQGFFEAEAEGLAYLHHSANVHVPQVQAIGAQFLILDYLKPAPARTDFWLTLGRQLAALHGCTRKEFGFFNDNFCGSTPQRNSFHSDGYTFFAEQRLWPLANFAHAQALLAPGDLADLERLIQRLPEHIPGQPASLLHGDLWSGNIHTSPRGEPVFIDPAVYFGWAEIDLAMTVLFGGFPDTFYDAYQEVRPLEPGWRRRLDVYNLYPLLNHLVLFGGAYLPRVRQVLQQFS